MDAHQKANPDWSALAELWLRTYYTDKPCVIFFRPLEHLPKLRHHFTSVHYACAIHADFSIVEYDLDTATRVCNETPKECFTMVWDGKQFVHENT